MPYIYTYIDIHIQYVYIYIYIIIYSITHIQPTGIKYDNMPPEIKTTVFLIFPWACLQLGSPIPPDDFSSFFPLQKMPPFLVGKLRHHWDIFHFPHNVGIFHDIFVTLGPISLRFCLEPRHSRIFAFTAASSFAWG